MEEILRTMLESLVDNKEAVSIETKQDGKTEVYTVKVAEEEIGKIIGKQGKIAKSIKTIVKALAAKEGKKVEIEFP